MIKNPPPARRGFTLVEILLCSIIILVIWLGPLDIFIRSARNVPYAQHMIQAIYFAEQYMEEWRRVNPFQDLLTLANTPPPGNRISLPINEGHTLNMVSGDCIATFTPIDSYRVHVQIDVTWKDGNLAGKETLTTDIANEPTIN